MKLMKNSIVFAVHRFAASLQGARKGAGTCLSAVLLIAAPVHSVLAAEQDDGSLLLRATLVSAAAAAVANANGLVEEAPETASVQLVEQQVIAGAVRRLRHYQYSEDQIVVVAVDRSGNELYRDIHTDPRLVRAEVPNAAGNLEYKEFYSPSASMAFSIPNDSSAQAVRLLKPKWNGVSFSFEAIGVLALN